MGRAAATELGRKDGEILLAGDGNVCSIDATAGVHIFSEGGRVLGKRLKILLPDQRNVSPIDTSARVYIAEAVAIGTGTLPAPLASATFVNVMVNL